MRRCVVMMSVVMIAMTVAASASFAETSLLVLYKSSEKDTAEQNIFAYHLQTFAELQGHKIVYHDVDRSLPTPDAMQKISAITTVFTGPIMKNARAYIHWLAEQILQQKKVLIIGNFGAFTPDGTTWYDGSVLNRVYYLLGLEFVGNWTNDPKLIQVSAKDAAGMMDFEAPLPSKLTHYFQINSLRPDNAVFLTLKRTDLKNSESAVVVKTPVGGLAMENYVFTQVNKQAKKLVNLEKFFDACLRDPMPPGAIPAKRILALYKTAEDDAPEKTYIARFLAKDLILLGYWPEYYAIGEQWTPPEQPMNRYHGMVTWFRTPDMTGAEAYADWLLAQITEGRKAIILGNFGAFGAMEQGKMADNPRFYEFFQKFGLEYRGNWTNDPKTLVYVNKVSDMVEAESKLTPAELVHYYQWKSALPENAVYLTVGWKDQPDMDSAFVVRTPFGGFAFEGYIFKSDPKTFQTSFFLNRTQFLKECLEYQ